MANYLISRMNMVFQKVACESHRKFPVFAMEASENDNLPPKFLKGSHNLVAVILPFYWQECGEIGYNVVRAQQHLGFSVLGAFQTEKRGGN